MEKVDISTLTFGQLLDESRNAAEKMNLPALRVIDERIDEQLREVARCIAAEFLNVEFGTHTNKDAEDRGIVSLRKFMCNQSMFDTSRSCGYSTTTVDQHGFATGGIICGPPRESDSDYCKNHTNLKTNKCFHIHDVDKWSGTMHFCGFCFKYLCPRCAGI